MKQLRPAHFLYKSHGVMWSVVTNNGESCQWLEPVCPTERCNASLEEKEDGYWCCNCERQFSLTKDYSTIRAEAERKWEGTQRWDYEVVSLDLPPTKVSDRSEDDNYWLQARIGEKNGKKMAVVYFGEKVKDQTKQDYAQLFLDFEDEQLRFDKSNKNPMKLLAKLVVEFAASRAEVVSTDENRQERIVV